MTRTSTHITFRETVSLSLSTVDFGVDSNRKSTNAIAIVLDVALDSTEEFAIVGRSFSGIFSEDPVRITSGTFAAKSSKYEGYAMNGAPT